MFKRYNNKTQALLVRRVLERVNPILEQKLNEISSTKFYDAADKAASYRNKKQSDMFREEGDIRWKREQEAEYENTINEIETLMIDGNKYILAEYLPTQMKVIIYFAPGRYVAIARITNNDIRNINRKEILVDIAAVYGKAAQTHNDNAHVIGASLEQNAESAKKLAAAINSDFEANVSWRYFFADERKKRVRNTTESKYKLSREAQIGDKTVFIVNPVANHYAYYAYYLFVCDANESWCFRVYKWEKLTMILGNQRPGPQWNAIKKGSDAWKGLAVPSPASCDYENEYNGFMALNSRTRRLILEFFTGDTKLFISDYDFNHAYDLIVGDTEASEVEKRAMKTIGVKEKEEQAAEETADAGSEFMDF